jgi:hypothetical protein
MADGFRNEFGMTGGNDGFRNEFGMTGGNDGFRNEFGMTGNSGLSLQLKFPDKFSCFCLNFYKIQA